MQPRALLRLSTTTFEEIANVQQWMHLHGLQWADLERAITAACRREGGATAGEIISSVIAEHGMREEDGDHLRWLIAYFAWSRVIEPVGVRRFRATTPPPAPRITALISIPPEEFELVRPYLWNGRPAFITEG